MTMNILIDTHHEELTVSLALLLEKRLGHNVYRQIGLEWYEKDLWRVYPALDTAMQYLGINRAVEWEEIKKKNAGAYCTFPNEGAYEDEDGIYLIPDYDYNYVHKAVTLDKFASMKFDLVISSIPDHIERFNRLIREYQPHAKHVFQVGNNWNVSRFNVKNILSSSKKSHAGSSQNSIFYYQEFDVEKYKRKANKENVHSVFNMKHYMNPQDTQIFNALSSLVSDKWKWLKYGSGNQDGAILTKDIPRTFENNGFLFHHKAEGDGFGYNMFHALSSGVPIITNRRHFSGMTIEDFLIHGTSCIDVGSIGAKDFEKTIERMASEYDAVSEKIARMFSERVSYEAEASRVKEWLETLV